MIIAGNHDLARVGELAEFDDARFAEAQADADAGYYGKRLDPPESAFRARWDLPSWEVAARDFSSFRTSQRALVATLLKSGRLMAAFSSGRAIPPSCRMRASRTRASVPSGFHALSIRMRRSSRTLSMVRSPMQ